MPGISSPEHEEHARTISHPYLTVGRERYDRVAASVGVEPRDPLLDVRVVSLCVSLPGDQKLDGTFHQALSTRIDLPERVDVIVSDLRGVLPMFQHHLPTVADARRRLLAPGGTLVPQADSLWTALVEDAKTYRPYSEPWKYNDFDLDLSAGRPFVVNTWRKVDAGPHQLLVSPKKWAEIDYRVVETTSASGEAAWTAGREGTAHGVLVWFDAELAEGVGFSNAPGQPEKIYGQAFFPLQEPVALRPGDSIEIRLRADLNGDDYTWQWRTRVTSGAEGGRVKADFRQSTFLGGALSPQSLRRREAGFRPALDEAGAVDRFILSLMGGETTLEEIARRALAEFPTRLRTPADAFARAGDLSAKYARQERPRRQRRREAPA